MQTFEFRTSTIRITAPDTKSSQKAIEMNADIFIQAVESFSERATNLSLDQLDQERERILKLRADIPAGLLDTNKVREADHKLNNAHCSGAVESGNTRVGAGALAQGLMEARPPR